MIGIAADGQPVGAALVKNLDEAPACYDLQQFMIDERYQNKGYGTEAMRLILALLQREGAYDCVEVCVNRANAPALRMCEKLGFTDTGYVDEAAPESRNLRFTFEKEQPHFSDRELTDFSDSVFRKAFREYFSELGIPVTDWDALFREMNEEGDNRAFVRTTEDGRTVGFIQFKPITFTSWFFEETCGFIREFWVADIFRGAGHGTELIALAENYFYEHGMLTSILTADEAGHFYEKHGYRKAPGCRAKNQDEVFIKRLNTDNIVF